MELLKQYGNVDCSYDLTPEQLCAKISLVDALIVRSGTKARACPKAHSPRCAAHLTATCCPGDAGGL